MMTIRHILPALTIAGVSLANLARLDARAEASIQWGPCETAQFNTTHPSDCANFTVPLDYTTSSSKETIKLQLARIKSPNQPAKGTILLNFGGPGEPGRSGLATQADTLLAMSNYEYNLLAFDPRGTVNTLPETCFVTPTEKNEYEQGQTWYDQNTTAMEGMWSRAGLNAELCSETNNKTQAFLGTAFVARDLISVVDALGEDGMLRYWGFSYGTVLGATVASMFPEKIERLVIDGVQNPHEYYHSNADFQEWTDADRVFSEVFRSCVRAGPQHCLMAISNQTAEELEKEAWALADKLKTQPIPIKGGRPLDYYLMRQLFAQATYGPSQWPAMAGALAAVATGATGTTAFAALYANFTQQENTALLTNPATYGIHCSDKVPRLQELSEFVPVQERLSNISKTMDGIETDISMTCAQWKTPAKERYTGDFNVKTKNPILLCSNVYDSHTPLISAQNVSAGFEGSAILVVNGFGHTTLAQASTCTIRRVAAYWHNGTLPAKGFVCEVDQVPYTNYTWTNAIQAVYNNQTKPIGSATTPGPQKPSSATSKGPQLEFNMAALATVSVFALILTCGLF